MTRVALLALLLTGCAGVSQKSTVGQPLWSYRADMGMMAGPSTFEGMGVTKLFGSIPIQVNSPVALDRLQVTTCARAEVYENVKNPFTFDYVPSPRETDGLCPMYIEAYSKDQLTSWGFLGFRQTETLPAHIWCNGEGYTYAGLSVCQTKTGLEQQLDFKKPVKFIAEKSCNLTTSDNQSFLAKPDKGFCRATFTAGGEYHRLIMLGYDSVLIRQ